MHRFFLSKLFCFGRWSYCSTAKYFLFEIPHNRYHDVSTADLLFLGSSVAFCFKTGCIFSKIRDYSLKNYHSRREKCLSDRPPPGKRTDDQQSTPAHTDAHAYQYLDLSICLPSENVWFSHLPSFLFQQQSLQKLFIVSQQFPNQGLAPDPPKTPAIGMIHRSPGCDLPRCRFCSKGLGGIS